MVFQTEDIPAKQIRYNPDGPVGEPETATLVIDAEDGWKWVYTVTGKH